MKRLVIFILFALFLVFAFNFMQVNETGYAFQENFGGPSAESVACMGPCIEIENNTEDFCMNKCGAEPQPEPEGEGEVCMQECILVGCGEREFDCQNSRMDSCEDECGMKGDALDESEMSEEEFCIFECVNKVDPSIICGSGSYEGEGETGGVVCQRCAEECVHLYAGPCLTDELWKEKEEECMNQGEHMEPAPVKGDSGEGYECTIDLECIDRSDEWGDNPGKGPGIGDPGYVAPNAVMEVVDRVVGFFKGIFGGESDEDVGSSGGEESDAGNSGGEGGGVGSLG